MLVFGIGKDLFNPSILEICCMIVQRELKLDGAIGQEEICNFLKSENFSKSFLSHIGKNKIKFKKIIFFGYHEALKIYGAPKLCTVM